MGNFSNSSLLLLLILAAAALVSAKIVPGGFENFRPEAKTVWDVVDPEIKRFVVRNTHKRFTASRVGDLNIEQGNKFIGAILGNESQAFYAGQETRIVVATAFMPKLANLTGDAAVIGGFRTNPHDVHSYRQYTYHLRGGRSAIDRNCIRSPHPRLVCYRNATNTPGFNISSPNGNVRVRVIAAYASRTSARHSPARRCDSSSHDVWAEFWGMGPRNLAFGNIIVYSGFVTFTVPPFDFRICVRINEPANRTHAGRNTDRGVDAGWQEFVNWGKRVFYYREPLYLYSAAGTNGVTSGPTGRYAGDYAAIRFFAHYDHRELFYHGHRRAQSFVRHRFTVEDNVKLVPFGTPCTYERPNDGFARRQSMDITSANEYCGSNYVNPVTGQWRHATCHHQGSFVEGIAISGSNRQNTLSTSTTPTGYVTAGDIASGSTFTAYIKLPAAGSYDICISTTQFRRWAFNSSVQRTEQGSYARDARPMWFKAYDMAASTCTGVIGSTTFVSACQSRSTVFQTTADPRTDVTWSMNDMSHLSWGAIKFTSATTLSYTTATAWDHSSTREYAVSAGGDQFRIVPEAYFTSQTPSSFGNLYAMSSDVTKRWKVPILTGVVGNFETTSTVDRLTVGTATTLTTTGAGSLRQYVIGTPSYGTQPTTSNAGCFWGGNDNYGFDGHFGNPGTQCCTVGSTGCTTANFCALSESGVHGPTASADIGGDPRTSYAPWGQHSTGTNAWGFIRLPPGGKYRVCYRRAGGNWRVIAKTGTTNVTFAPTALNAGYTYSINDTRAETWGAIRVHATRGNLFTRQNWNFYKQGVADGSVVGSALKIVQNHQSCETSTAQTRAYSWRPGALEGAGSLGSADDSSTATNWVAFYVRIPAHPASTTTKYRICFRNKIENWHVLKFPQFVTEYYLNTVVNSAEDFYPSPKPIITYTLADTRQGSWGLFRFTASAAVSTTAQLDAHPVHGDMFRIVVNETLGTEMGRQSTGCDIVEGTTTEPHGIAQQRNLATQVSDLGVWCAAADTTTTSYCYYYRLRPNSDSQTARTTAYFPYSQVDPRGNAPRIGSISTSDGTAAFITLPARFTSTAPIRPLHYKVCYKNARLPNWIEAVSNTGSHVLTISAAAGYALGSTSNTVAGAFGFVAVTATAASPITWRFAVLKLVAAGQTCDAPAVGTSGFNQNFVSLANGQSGSNTNPLALVVDGTNATQIQGSAGVAGTTTIANAYMVYPQPANAHVAATTAYTVCFMNRLAAVDHDYNWYNLGSISVVNYGITFTISHAPVIHSTLTIRFLGTPTYPLNTQPSGDMAKVVAATSPCVGTETVPSVVTSTHVGTEFNAATTGISNLGPTDDLATTVATADVVLASATFVKVCYKRLNAPWVEVPEAPLVQRWYNNMNSTIQPTTSAISSFTLASVFGKTTGESTTYTSGVSYANLVLGGLGSTSSSMFKVTLTSSDSTSRVDTLKLVRTNFEISPGVYSSSAAVNCLSEAFETYNISTTASNVDVAILINFPLEQGKYLVCYKRWNTAFWYQVPAASGSYGNPFTIISSMLAFESPTSTSFRVEDFYANATHSLGAVAVADYVYLVNNTDVCGVSNTWQNLAFASNNAPLNSSSNTLSTNTSDFLPYRDTGLAITKPTTGWYKLCYYRSQEAASNASSKTPFTRVGHYQLANIGVVSTGGGTNFFVGSAATKLAVVCPQFNLTYRLRSGRPAATSVFAANAANQLVPFSSSYYADLATATTTGSYALNNLDGDCKRADTTTYGWDMTNLNQFLYNGRARFFITSLSACPTGGCVFSFSTPTSGIAASSSCTFDVLPTFINNLAIATGPTSCNVGEECTFRIAALHADGEPAFTATDAIALAFAGDTGLTITTLVGGSSVTASAAGNFANGYFTFNLRFVPSSYSATTSQAVVIAAAANGKTITHTVNVLRPTIAAMHIVDVYPVDNAGQSIRPLTPTWEPTSTPIRNFAKGATAAATIGSATLSAASGYHLVARQYYTVVIRPVGLLNGNYEYVSVANLVSSSAHAITIDQTALNSAGNTVLSGGCADEFCTTALGSTAFGSTSGSVTFALRNAKGCSRTSPCTIAFKFGGADVGSATSITTPVRSIASSLTYKCGADDYLSTPANLATATGSCGTSTPNFGWFVEVRAVDADGGLDEFHDLDAVALFSNTPEGTHNGRGHRITTSDLLAAGATALAPVKRTFSSGVALFRRLTPSRPCAAGFCPVVIVSESGANHVAIGNLVATANTNNLKCTLNKALGQCELDGTACKSLTATTAANVVNADSLIYKDTEICAIVEAVDSNAVNTLYETNWISYWATDVAGAAPLTVTDTTTRDSAFAKRYRAMVNSRVSFCFTVSTTASALVKFNVRFAAQRFNDANYWARATSTGTCSLGPMSLWPTKLVASFRLTKVTGATLVSTNLIAAEKTSSATLVVGLEFAAYDHYGNAIAAGNVNSFHNGYQVIPATSAGVITIGQIGSSVGLRGLMNASEDTTKTAKNVNNTIAYTLNIDKYCLGCTVTFNMVDPSNSNNVVSIRQLGASVATAVTNVVKFYIINKESTTTRRLAFTPSVAGGANPFSYWINGSTSTTSNSPPALWTATCWGTTCRPQESAFLHSVCDPRGVSTIYASSLGAAIKMQVLTVDASASLTWNFESTATNLATVSTQLDVLNSYTVTVSIGTQLLKCVSGTCTNDGTAAVSQSIASYGATLAAVVGNLDANFTTDASLRATSFALQGLTASTYSAITSGTFASGVTPSVSGEFAATAVDANSAAVTVSGIAITGRRFAWRSSAIAKKFVLLDTAINQDDCAAVVPTFDCHDASSGNCVYNGSAKVGTITDIGYNYFTQATVPAGRAFPVTLEVRDENNFRVQGATGTIAAFIDSWSGCNNGGTLTLSSGALVNGRLTAWLTFSAPCQACSVTFMLTPDSSQTSTIFRDMVSNPNGFYAYSRKAITVVSALPTQSHVIITATTPANLLTSGASVAATVKDSFSLSFKVRSAFGRIPVDITTARATVVAYISSHATGTNGNWWVGNGGVLRKDTASSAFAHHGTTTTFTGTGTLSFMFTRVCTSCNVRIWYELPGTTQDPASFMLGPSFVVSTTASRSILVGWMPRNVAKNTNFALALWTVGSDDSSIPAAGVAKPASAIAQTPVKTVDDSTNFNGGLLRSSSWVVERPAGNVELHILRFTATCNKCTLSFGSGVATSFQFAVTTSATHIRPVFTTPGSEIVRRNRNQDTTYTLRAVDDEGMIDISVGSSGCMFPWNPFACGATTAVLSFGTSNDGFAESNFPQTTADFLFAATDAITTTSAGSLNSGVGTATIAFQTPVRYVVPVFKVATISSLLSAGRPAFIIPRVTVADSLTGLTLWAVPVGDKTKVSTGTAFSFDVALTKALTGDAAPANRYVNADADNLVTITTSAACPPLASTTMTSFNLERGYARVAVVFTGSDSASCTVTFTAGAGTGRCTGASCVTAVSGIVVKNVVADSWAWVRPTMWDNAGAAAGLRFGAAGRRTFVTVQAMGKDANNLLIAVRECRDCQLRITKAASASATCAFTTNSLTSSQGPYQVFVNGTATVEITWTDASVAEYTCAVLVQVSRDATGTTFLAAPDSSTGITASVTVCRPARVVLLTNTSSVYRGRFIAAGAPASFYAIMTTSTGAQCVGDSQDDATQLAIDAIAPGAVAVASTNVYAVNVNTTDTTTAGYMNGWMSATPINVRVRAIGGGFNFAVVFTNASNATRLRIRATSTVPDISGANALAISGPVDTIIAATRLSWAPGMAIPPVIVADRVINTAPMGERRNTALGVDAIDGIEASWNAIFSFIGRPNIARRASEAGNNAAFQWNVQPPQSNSQFPFTFGTGSAVGALTAGRTNWTDLKFSGADGNYAAVVETTAASPVPLAPTPALRFTSQRMVRLALNVSNFSTAFTSTRGICASNCPLPNNTFTVDTNTTINPTAFLRGKNLVSFDVEVAILDARDQIVIADDESVIEATLTANSLTDIVMGVPPAFLNRTTIPVRVRRGIARFSLSFLGSTAINGNNNNHGLAQVTFACPATRRAGQLQAGEVVANTCAGLSSLASMRILIENSRPADVIFNDASVTTKREVIKVRSSHTALSAFNHTLFFQILADRIPPAFNYINLASIAKGAASAILCGVTSFFEGTNDLGSSVCAGGRCDAASGSRNCPAQVLSCMCPAAAARQAILSRFLLQNSSGNASVIASLAFEFFFDLGKAEGFAGKNATEIADAYTALQAAAKTVITGSEFAPFRITSVTSRPLNSAPNTATPLPTPIPPVVVPPPPPPPSPVVTPTPPASGASAASLLLALALAALLSLIVA